jgi:HSP20 family molecular chaperone IbpA
MAAFFPRNCNYYGSAEPGFTSLFRLLDDFDSYSRSQSPNDNPKNSRRSHLPTFQPKFDVRETDETYELHGELAGMNKQDVHVEFSDSQTMTVRGHIERSYVAGTPPAAAAAAIENSGTISTDRPTTPTSETEAAESSSSNTNNDNGAKSPSLKATVEDEEDEAGYTQIATLTSEAKPSNTISTVNTVNTTNNNVGNYKKPNTDRAKYWVSERSIGEFSRSFNFPQRVDHDGVTATLNDGILTITVPKAKRHEARRIVVG